MAQPVAMLARRSFAGSSLFAAAALSATALASFNLDVLGYKGMTAEADAPAPKAATALDPAGFKAFPLKEKTKLTHNTFLLRFELPADQASGMYTASCLVTRAMIKDKPEDDKPKPVIRPYTPASPVGAKGYLDLVVKVYPTGKMSKYIGDLKIGDTLEMKGPIPKYPYQPNIKKKIGMVAGGTGITPMLQVIDAALADPSDKTEISLIFANESDSDIILKEKIDHLAATHKNFKVFYVVSKPWLSGWFWWGGVGYITKDMIKQHLPPPDKDNLIMVCGPPGMMDAISGNKAPDYTQGEVRGLLRDLGYDATQVYKF